MGRILKEKNVSYNQKILILSVFPVFCLFYGMLLGKEKLLEGFLKIIFHQGILITDFIYIGGLYSSFLNVAFIGILNLVIIYFLKIPMNGTIFSAYFLVIGFSFFGKTILNILPIYFGGFLLAKFEKRDFKNIFGVLMFSTGLSPVVSFFLFNKDLLLSNRIIISISLGIIIGFIMPCLSAHMVKFHDGYNLYNVGFTTGIVGLIFASITRKSGIQLEANYILSSEFDLILKIILVSLFSLYIFLGYYINQNSFEGYDDLLSSSGRLITDYLLSEGFGISLINSGILGLLGLSLTTMLSTPLNGPIIAGLFSIFAFGVFGKNPLNCSPIVIGIILTNFLKISNFDNFTVVLASLFGTTLAPISGVYGLFAGLIAGFFHIFITNSVEYLHGGFNLYNNGFAGGIVSSILAPLFNRFYRKN